MANTIVFKTLRGANFFRFGNEEFVFDFRTGVIGLMGDNGLGKSAILDALCICLFNESYRKSTQDDWTNNINGTGLYFNLSIDRISSNVDEFIITRKPTARKSIDKLSIYKNGTLLTDIQNPQEYIETNILGFGINIFKNSIAVSGGTPFISMTPDEKRKFSDNLFSIKQVREYKKKISELLSELQLSKRIIEQEISTANSKISEYRNVLSMAVSNVDSQISEVEAELLTTEGSVSNSRAIISEAHSNIASIEESIAKANNELVLLDDRLVQLNAVEVYTNIGIVTSQLETCKRDYNKALAEMNRIAPNVVCTSCGNFYTEAQANEHRSKHESEAAAIADKGKLVRSKLTTLQESLPKIEAVKQTINNIKNVELAGYNNRIYQLKATISSNINYISTLDLVIYRLRSKINTLKTQEDQSSVRLFAENAILESNELMTNKTAELQLIIRKINAANYIINMCSDNGIKHLLLKEYMPILNKLIAYYLNKFDLPVTIEFDEYFGHSLSAPNGLGQKHSLMSKGQRTRINLAILFAVVDLIKKMGNVNCSSLILDEFADEGLDANGFIAAVECIRKVADRDNKCIVLITHKQEDVVFDNLDALYQVELKNNFSVLREISSF